MTLQYPTLVKLMESVGDPTLPVLPEQLDDVTPDHLHALAEFIHDHCSHYLQQCDDYPIYRGIKRRSVITHPDGTTGKYPLAFIKDVRVDRRPRDSTESAQTRMVEYIKDLGLHANRHNSMFVSGRASNTQSYGITHIVFPIGQFHYTWSPYIDDAVNGMVHTIFRDPLRKFLTMFEMSETQHYTPRTEAERQVINEFKNNVTFQQHIEKYTALEQWESVKDDLIRMVPSDELERVLSDTQVGKRQRRELIFRRVWWAVVSNGPEGKDPSDPMWFVYDQHVTQQDIDRLREAAMTIVKRVTDAHTVWRGDDGSLVQAIKSEHEIMISCSKYLAVTPRLYKQLAPILGMKAQ